MASMDKSVKKDKNQNIQVFVRLRPLNSRERSINSRGAVEVINNREVVVRQLYQASHSKKFTFDRAFGPNAEQVEVYKEVVSPLIAEVLAGYNCTVFAYGQTGTGKTHTMVGENSGEGTTWQNDPLAGIIPRALSQLFDELRISNTEYNVRVSYLELYNEELCDLLSPSWDTSKLRIYEDVNRKGSTIVNGLEEITVYNKNEVYEIMARGQERKKVASTLMNSQSSRSHTVFTIVVHIKENSNKGEELVKIGKLNLVDLAGSENISKAGTDNPSKKERARECVNINQSLLTLGRVITALVEKHPHIPYRESKLTRILQESLGGRTKTSIIATISPGSKDLEETMSTLEYANRAKNIQNKPEVNQKLTKQAILKEYAEEVDKLKRELMAAREKNGVYLPTETYEEMMIKHDEQRREIQELLLKKRAMEEERERMESVFRDLETQHSRTANELSSTRNQLDQTVSVLEETAQQFEEQRHLVMVHVQTEQQLAARARQVLAAADTAAAHAAALHDTVNRRKSIENTNQESVSAYRNASTTQRELMLGQIQALTDTYTDCRNQLQHNIDNHTKDTSMTEEINIQDLKLLAANLASAMNEIMSFQKESDAQISESRASCVSELSGGSMKRQQVLQQALESLLPLVGARLARAASTHPAAAVQQAVSQWQSDATVRVSNLQQSHSSFTQCARKLEDTRAGSARRRHSQHLQHIQRGEEQMTSLIQQVEKDKQSFEERMSQQIALIESERDQTERRLEEIARNVETVRSAVHTSATNHIAELRNQWQQYQANTQRYLAAATSQVDEAKAHHTTAITHVDETEQETTQAMQHVDEYDKEFGEGKSAIEAEIHAFSDSVVQIVTHTKDQLLTELDGTKTMIEQKVTEVKEEDSVSTKQLLDNVTSLVDRVAQTASNALAVAANKTQEISSSSQSSINAVISHCSALSSSALEQQATQSAILSRATSAVTSADSGLRQHIADHADTEAKYLMHEYRVYAPTGNTPARHEYRYPRQLPATSPHDRILQRFRQRRQPTSPDSDCIIVPEYEAHNGHDSDEASESSVSEMSEDSGVVQQ